MVSVCIVGSFLVMYFSRDGIFWSTIDNWVGTFLIFILAMVEIICFSWVFGVDRGIKEAHHGALMKIPGFYRVVLKYVTPTYLLVVFAAFAWSNLGGWVRDALADPLQLGALALIVAVLALLVVCLWIGEYRWRLLGMDVDGREPAASVHAHGGRS
jgi:neurotransmitter:Na+ symporter, NSS family